MLDLLEKTKCILAFLMIVWYVGTPFNSFSQDQNVEVQKLNFAVPDIPALKTLNSDFSNILRPSDIKSVSVITSNFYNAGQIILPSRFALELAPLLLVNSSNLTLQKYNDSHVAWRSLRISVGSLRDSTTNFTSRIAFGLRTTLVDKQDYKGDKAFQRQIVELQASRLLNIDKIRDQCRKDLGFPPDFDNNPDQLKKVNECIESKRPIDVDQAINQEKIDYKRKNWNKTKIDAAIGASWASEDSVFVNKDTLFNKVLLHRVDAWITGAFPFPATSNWGQAMVGINMNNKIPLLPYDTTRATSFSLPFRYYAGTNKVKGFAEFQYSQNFEKNNDFSSWLLTLGSELSITDGIWLNVYFGVTTDSRNKDERKLVSHFDLRFTIPEKSSLF